MGIAVHSFMFHLGDWYAHTAHLTPMEDLAYRRLIDVYYLHQKPPEGQPEQVARAIRLREHACEVAQVLSEFFVAETDLVDGTSVTRWRNKRCDAEIERYQAMADGGKRGAAKRWSKGGDSPPIAPPSPPLTPPNANQEPLTTNHEPLTNKEKTKRVSAPASEPNKTKGTRIPFTECPDDWREFCRAERSDLDPIKVWDGFHDYWIAVPGAKGVKADWFATWRNWVRNQRQTTTAKQNDSWQAKLASLNTIDMEPTNGQVLSTDIVPF
jgi:uncharacterized protein YdaU (DUF1376 family)